MLKGHRGRGFWSPPTRQAGPGEAFPSDSGRWTLGTAMLLRVGHVLLLLLQIKVLWTRLP